MRMLEISKMHISLYLIFIQFYQLERSKNDKMAKVNKESEKMAKGPLLNNIKKNLLNYNK